MSYLGDNIRYLRKKKGLSINELASLIKASKSSLSEIENGKRDPTWKLILAISNGLQVDVTKLVAQQETNIYKHEIDLVLKFEDGTSVFTGTSESNLDEIVAWGLVVDGNMSIVEKIVFKANNDIIFDDFVEKQLIPYFSEQRMRISMWKAIELEGCYQEAKKNGINVNWDVFKEIISKLQILITNKSLVRKNMK